MMWMADPLSRTAGERNRDDWDVLELFLQLLKHLLLVPDPEHRTGLMNAGAGVGAAAIPMSLGERFLHDTTLQRFEADNVFAAALVLATGLNEAMVSGKQDIGTVKPHFEVSG